jgi:hypothetical protein
MLELITQALRWFLDTIPRPVIVTMTEKAVSVWRFPWWNSDARECGSGWYVVWPLFQEWFVVCVESQLCETATIPVSAADGTSWQFRLAIEYEIDDAVRYRSCQYSGQQQLEMLGGAALVMIMSEFTSERFHRVGIRKVCHVIQKRITDLASMRGIRVLQVKAIMSSCVIPVFISKAERLVDG